MAYVRAAVYQYDIGSKKRAHGPDHTTFSNKAVPPERDNDRMTWPCASQVPTNDCTAGYYGLSAKYDVLWASDRCAAGNFVPCILPSKLL